MVEMFGILLGTMMVYVCFNFTPHEYTVFEEIKWVKEALCKQNKLLVYLTVVMQIKHFKSSHISEGKNWQILVWHAWA